MSDLLYEILNNFEQEKANKKALEQQKENDKKMFLDAWEHICNDIIGKSMKQFGDQLRPYHHMISYQRKTPPGHSQTEDSYSIELSDSRLICRLWFAISEPERKVIVIKQYAYKYRKGRVEVSLPSSIPKPLSETLYELVDITPDFLEQLVAECMKTLLNTLA
jgi:hypothetical protein